MRKIFILLLPFLFACGETEVALRTATETEFNQVGNANGAMNSAHLVSIQNVLAAAKALIKPIYRKIINMIDEWIRNIEQAEKYQDLILFVRRATERPEDYSWDKGSYSDFYSPTILSDPDMIVKAIQDVNSMGYDCSIEVGDKELYGEEINCLRVWR